LSRANSAAGIRALLELQPGIEICGEASSGVKALEHIRKGKPDLVVPDPAMPNISGLNVARAVNDQSPGHPSAHSDDALF
jgi:YesN/AraC family two-component response regulator